MTNVENIRLVMDAIKSVKYRAKEAFNNGDQVTYAQLMYDLIALENCLVTEVDKGLKSA